MKDLLKATVDGPDKIKFKTVRCYSQRLTLWCYCHTDEQ